MNIENEKQELLKKKTALALDKREHETRLVAVKNTVRTGGRLPREKYKQCCNSQYVYTRAILSIERQLAQVKTRLREISDIEFNERSGGATREEEDPKVETALVKSIGVELVSLRQEYRNFVSDGTQPSLMRKMAAEFVLKLDPIVERATDAVPRS